MDYDRAMTGEEVTRKQVKRELAAHGFTFEDFLADGNPDRELYNSADVLAWLGY